LLLLAALFSRERRKQREQQHLPGEKRWRRSRMPRSLSRARARARRSVIGILNARRSAGIFHGVLSPGTLYFPSVFIPSLSFSLSLSLGNYRLHRLGEYTRHLSRGRGYPLLIPREVSRRPPRRGELFRLLASTAFKYFHPLPCPSNVARLSTLFQWINSLPAFPPHRGVSRFRAVVALSPLLHSPRGEKGRQGVCTQLHSVCTCSTRTLVASR